MTRHVGVFGVNSGDAGYAGFFVSSGSQSDEVRAAGIVEKCIIKAQQDEIAALSQRLRAIEARLDRRTKTAARN